MMKRKWGEGEGWSINSHKGKKKGEETAKPKY
jgi:hypothetical protein